MGRKESNQTNHILYINKYTYDQMCSIPKLKGFLAAVHSFIYILSFFICLFIIYIFVYLFINSLFFNLIIYVILFIYLFIYLFSDSDIVLFMLLSVLL